MVRMQDDNLQEFLLLIKRGIMNVIVLKANVVLNNATQTYNLSSYASVIVGEKVNPPRPLQW